MSWTVRTLELLSRDVTGLPDRVKQEALDWIDELAHDPFPDGCLKMRDTTIAIDSVWRQCVPNCIHGRHQEVTIYRAPAIVCLCGDEKAS